MITIIYYTDNSLEPELTKKLQTYLIESAKGKPIISVSQKPIDFGNNICIGDIGRSHLSMYNQIFAGIQKADTKYIGLAEHDCLYVPRHFDWVPPRDDIFYYNKNHYFVLWNEAHAGRYYHFHRKALSQLICNRDIFIEELKRRIYMLEKGFILRKGQPGACEPGVCVPQKAMVGSDELWDSLGEEYKIKKYESEIFKTEYPNIDIRHGKNFSGVRKGGHRSWSIPYWGSFHKVMDVLPPGRWYQEATINGVEMPFRRKYDTSEKRWNKYIKPLLPFEGKDRIFLDLGCNAGFYCRKASDLGFKVIGVEKERTFLRHAFYWETCEPKGVKIEEGDINKYKILSCHVAILANVHYWQSKEEFKNLIDKLREKALYVIVIGRHKALKQHKSSCDFANLKKSFNGWEIGNNIRGNKHFSVIFKNNSLVEKDTEEIFHHQQLAKSKKFLPSYSALIKEVIHNNGTSDYTNYLDSDYFKYLKWRRFPKPERYLKRHVDLVKSMEKEGIINPLEIGRVEGFEYKENRLVDGDHRYIVAKELGINKLVCKKVAE